MHFCVFVVDNSHTPFLHLFLQVRHMVFVGDNSGYHHFLDITDANQNVVRATDQLNTNGSF